MSESNSNSGELADLLWERQGSPVNRTPDNWLETEYRAHPPAILQRPVMDQSEADLRMRGIGPLINSQPDAEMRAEYKLHPILYATACGIAVVVGLVMVLSLFGGAFRSVSSQETPTFD